MDHSLFISVFLLKDSSKGKVHTCQHVMLVSSRSSQAGFSHSAALSICFAAVCLFSATTTVLCQFLIQSHDFVPHPSITLLAALFLASRSLVLSNKSDSPTLRLSAIFGFRYSGLRTSRGITERSVITSFVWSNQRFSGAAASSSKTARVPYLTRSALPPPALKHAHSPCLSELHRMSLQDRSAMANTTPNLEFAKLSSSVSLFTPPSTTNTPQSKTDPTLIIVCQWMGVSPRSRALSEL